VVAVSLGTVAKADGKAQVFDPEKKAIRLAKTAEVREEWRQKNRKAEAAGEAPVAKKASAKKPAKKAAGAKKKSTGGKKAGGAKKKTTKK
jgi:hypothetical protein